MSHELGLCSVIGFAGDVPDGLICHPDGIHVIYPLGSTIVVRRRDDPSDQKFLRGHSDKVRDTQTHPAACRPSSTLAPATPCSSPLAPLNITAITMNNANHSSQTSCPYGTLAGVVRGAVP